MAGLHDDLFSFVRSVTDFPIPGVTFRDLTPLMADPPALGRAVSALADPFRTAGIARVAGVEARGFIFGALVARELAAGFVPLRKPGKLPAGVEAVSYALEYGTASLEIHRDALPAGARVLLVDDVLATGGTAAAAVELLARVGGVVAGAAFLLELPALLGRERIPGCDVRSVLRI
ncbi:MAG: adenine phosphoribosyltransferase [Betaproteobacteria bacterium]|jgi:adenine phosphoribosyltransferase|nr:adenine phosphoribosyltransferase [Betaproteobacteria bacterium]